MREQNAPEHTQQAAASSEVEEAVRGVFQDVLGPGKPVDVTRSFFQIGGTSIMAAKAVARLSARFQVHLALRTIFAFPSARELARVVESEVLSAVSGLSDAEVLALTTREK